MELINRKLTNAVRFVMDELIPPFIRDSRVFMYPFYQYWFKGKNISRIMEFESYFHTLSDSDIQAMYCSLECRTHDRGTANIENLPFADKHFGIVTCNHTLEHVIHLERAISELKRIARRQLVITVPCQKYYYYTLDLHIHFFPCKSMLINSMGVDNHTCVNLSGDLVYIARL
jgi:hypothetical protein